MCGTTRDESTDFLRCRQIQIQKCFCEIIPKDRRSRRKQLCHLPFTLHEPMPEVLLAETKPLLPRRAGVNGDLNSGTALFRQNIQKQDLQTDNAEL
jgi:hypothetical protein